SPPGGAPLRPGLTGGCVRATGPIGPARADQRGMGLSTPARYGGISTSTSGRSARAMPPRRVPLPNRIRVALIATLTIISSLMVAAPAGAAVTPQKVVIIVGPTGALTDNYRSKGDSIALTAAAAGATVVKVYSPNATWANVKAAVNGANI